MAREKLETELELENIVSTKRIQSFALKNWMTRRQRLSVKYFKRYNIVDSQIDKECHHKSMSIDRIVDECKPDEDPIDRRILYELTGRKAFEDDYLDDSSMSEEKEEDDSDKEMPNETDPSLQTGEYNAPIIDEGNGDRSESH